MPETRLLCISPAAAQTVAAEASGHGPQHTAHADGPVVVLTYFDARFPLDVAEWAFDNGHADDDAASAVIASL